MFRELAVGQTSELLPCAPELDPQLLEFASRLKGKRQESFLASRILLLTLLRQFYPQLAALPQTRLMQYGKPYFPSFRCFFNLTHSATTVIAYVSDEGPCAVDLEFLKPRHNFEALKNKVLGPAERDYYEHLKAAEQLETFTAFWTVRECVLKLSGRGLGGLSRIEIDPAGQCLKCADNQPAMIYCVRFDEYLDGRPCFCSFSKLADPRGTPLEEEELVGRLAAFDPACTAPLAKNRPDIGWWQYKAGRLVPVSSPPLRLTLRLS